MTGVGKTLLLSQIGAAQPNSVLDFEGIAQHRASAFGGFKLKCRTQKQFESELHRQIFLIQAQENPIASVFLEAEGPKIGQITLRPEITANIRTGRRVMCVASLQTRIERLVQEYRFHPEDEHALASMRQCTENPMLVRALGTREVSKLQDCLSAHDLHEFVRILLVQYYDPLYTHSMKRFEASSGRKVDLLLDTENLVSAAEELLHFRDSDIKLNQVPLYNHDEFSSDCKLTS